MPVSPALLDPLASTDAGVDASDAAQPPHFDPRQGTLLGFELPPDALEALKREGARADGEGAAPVNVPEAAFGPAASIAPKRAREVAPEVAPEVVPTPSAGRRKSLVAEPTLAPADAVRVGGSTPMPSAGADGGEAERLQSSAHALSAFLVAPAAATASAACASSTSASPSTSTAAAAPTAASLSATHTDDSAPRAGTAAPAAPAASTRTLVSLNEALQQERHAAEQRWRRTRNWLALALAGVALLVVASIAQSVAMIGFARRADAAQQQAQLAMAEQKAALASLANATSALSARMPAPPDAGAAADAAAPSGVAQQQAKHAKPVHVRRLKDKGKDKDQAKPVASR
ncbi:MAG TPA: hypothetical protein VL635_16840 [Trinickia sp.]|nr:hypothetical protein [Trinickia sp.]